MRKNHFLFDKKTFSKIISLLMINSYFKEKISHNLESINIIKRIQILQHIYDKITCF